MCSRLSNVLPLSRLLTSNITKSGHCYASVRLCSALSDVDKHVTETLTTTVQDGGYTIEVDKRSKFAFYLDTNVREDIEKEKYKPTKHPGQRSLAVEHLPEELMKAVKIVLENMDTKELKKEAQTLTRRIWDREGPLEDSDREEKMRAILASIVNQEEVDPSHPSVQEADRKSLLKQRNNLFNKKIKSEIHNYKPLDFSTSKSCLVYLMSRLQGDYVALLKVFNEVRHELPHFLPTTLLDFGSGVGSVSWAADKIWPQKCKESFNVDASAEMNQLNEMLLKGGTLNGQFSRRENTTFFRQFLPASGAIKHKLVVASRTLFELPSREMRLRTLDILWKTVAPGGCIVLVESGQPRGSQYILEAREFLLEGVDSSSSTNRGRVIAPCRHQLTCPLNKKQKKYRICSDCNKFLPIGQYEAKLEIFSYVVIHKPADDMSEEKYVSKYSWPRVVQPVLRPSGQSIVRVCNSFGNLQELCVSKGKHGKLGYRVGKATQLGDLLPVTLLPPEQHLIDNGSVFQKTKAKLIQDKVSKQSGADTSSSHDK